MASGMACVSNANPDTGWFLEDGRNCLLARPTPGGIADRLGELVEDAALRERIVAAGLEQVRALGWDDQIEQVWRAMTLSRMREPCPT
jgi:glycosyltransferase involved in cell wall biosynthesis